MAASQDPLSKAIQLRVLKDLDEFQATLQVQKEVWDFSEMDQIPHRLFGVIRYIGGLVLGAYDGERLIGFNLSLPGIKPGGQGYWHSHMTGVVPAYQNLGIGRQLKLRQRQEAISAGIDLVEWMFDPLEIRNAHFNIERLGVIVRRYVRNQYGITSSPLHGSLPTDRLVPEWHVNSSWVQAIVDQGVKVQKNVASQIEIPAEIGRLRKTDPEAARQVQSRVREQFEERFAAGLAVIGYRRTEASGIFELGRLDEQPVKCAA